MKTKEELIDGIIKAIDQLTVVENTTELDSVDLIDSCFNKKISNRIKDVADRIGQDGIETILEHCRAKGAEFKKLQERHSADIRAFKSLFASDPRVTGIPLYPANVHVVTENPLTFGVTMVGYPGEIRMECVNEAEVKEVLKKFEHMDDGSDSNDLKCPACGSTWEMFKDVPVVHCCRCNTHWLLFTRRILKCTPFLDPVSKAKGVGGKIKEEYMNNPSYTVNNKGSIANIKRAIDAIHGDKIVSLVGASGKYAGWQMKFQVINGQIENESHFDECVDQALIECKFKRDVYTGKNYNETMLIVIRSPKCQEADMDDLSMTCGTDEQVVCNTYGIVATGGMLNAMDMNMMEMAYQDDATPGDDFQDLTKLCPWFVTKPDVHMMDDDLDDPPMDTKPKNERKQILN